uniref:Major capsid protein N-terminal domain-containing protein n=1 Tax=viral metagenome TaxID=1070528 RepID=A0A6C0B6D1_9ZZZZ
MPGGLIQLTGFGAQNVFVNGNPSMTYFIKMYKRTTNFAMEHFRLSIANITDTTLPAAGKKTFNFPVPRYADLLHDCYVCVQIPDIWSPLSGYDQNTSEAYETAFQWSRNLGFNMIDTASVLFNGNVICSVTGEWLKVKSYLKSNKTQRDKLDTMVGNTPDMYDPANARGRLNQYPNAINVSATNTAPPAPSIRGRQLTIPLSFWFCEEIGQSLPLVSLPQTEVVIQITFRNIYQMFTVLDTRGKASTNPTFQTRIVGNPGDSFLGIQNYLSYPDTNGNPTNASLVTWNLDPYIEANYIFMTDTERAHIAANERSFLVTQVRSVKNHNQYGYNDVVIPMYNLCTRVIFLFQREDRVLVNDWDNYTNWDSIFYPPVQTYPSVLPTLTKPATPDQWYSTGIQLSNSMNNQDILQEGNLVFDGTDRFVTKNINFFRNIQNYRFSEGDTSSLPGINLYSFALDPNTIAQPSGSANGSMFNKTSFKHTLLVPPVVQTGAVSQIPVCVVKDTALSTNPTPVPNGATTSAAPGIPPLIQPGQTLTVYPSPTNLQIQYNGYSSIIYVESYNFLKVTNGQANLVFNT